MKNYSSEELEDLGNINYYELKDEIMRYVEDHGYLVFADSYGVNE